MKATLLTTIFFCASAFTGCGGNQPQQPSLQFSDAGNTPDVGDTEIKVLAMRSATTAMPATALRPATSTATRALRA